MGDDIVIVHGGENRAVEDGFKFESGAHASQLEISEPQLAVRQLGVLSMKIQTIGRSVRHWVRLSLLALAKFGAAAPH